MLDHKLKGVEAVDFGVIWHFNSTETSMATYGSQCVMR